MRHVHRGYWLSAIGYSFSAAQRCAEQHLKPLYSSHQRYVDEVVDTTRKLVNQRYITREDGTEIIRYAKDSDVPTLADIPSDLPDQLQ